MTAHPARRRAPGHPVFLLALLLLILALLAARPDRLHAQEGSATPETYTVQPGETLSEIAKANGYTLEQLMRVNGIPNPDAIYVGQVLRFPLLNRPPGVTIHVVVPGETLSQIARLYDVPMRAIMAENNIANANGIVSGQELIIPGIEPTVEGTRPAAEATPAPPFTAEEETATATARPTEEPAATPAPAATPGLQPEATTESGLWVHTVKPGETASEIAKLYGVRLADLLAVNGIANADLIRTGAELVIPGSAQRAPAPSAAAATPTVQILGEPEVVIIDVPTEQPAGEPAQEPAGEPAQEPAAEPMAEVPAKPTVPVIPLEVPTAQPLPDRPATSLNRPYTVVSGDTPLRIALRLGLDVDSLLRLNNLEQGARLVAGQTLLLPATERELRVVSDAHQYVVKPGDSLSAIAKSNSVKLADLMSANRISNPNLISVGESLIIPGKELRGDGPLVRVGPARSGYYFYTVRAGDTLSELARSLNSTKIALIEYNNLPDETTVYAGMELRVPFGAPALPVRQPPVPVSGSRFLISLSRQQCWVYSGRDVRHAWNCSTGYGQWRTRTGNFAVQSKIENAKSNVWRLDMPWWLGIYDVGRYENGIHGLPVDWDTGRKIWTQLIGQPATFGCAMLGDEDAEALFTLAYIGMPVHIIQ